MASYIPWRCKESDTTEWFSHTHMENSTDREPGQLPSMELQTDTTEQVTHIHTPLHDPGLWFTSALYYFQTWFCPPQQEGMYRFPAYYLSVPNPRLWSWNISPSLSDMTVISVRREYGRDPGGGKISPSGSGCFLYLLLLPWARGQETQGNSPLEKFQKSSTGPPSSFLKWVPRAS